MEKLNSTPGQITTKSKKELADKASSTLEAALGALDLLIDVTENVPYLGLIAGCIKKLIEIRNTMQHNKELACQLCVTVEDLTELVARGLHDLDTANRETAMTHLEDDLKRYQSIVKDIADILAEWTSMAWIKRAWKYGDFADIAASIDRKLASFRDVFSLARLIDLSKGQDDLKLKMGQVINRGVRQNLKEWLKPANVGASHRSAAAARHPGSGLWLLEESAQFREWMYSSNSFLWLYGISGSGKTVLSSSIIETVRGRGEACAFFYFEVTDSEQRTITHLLCSLVIQLSVQFEAQDQVLHALWKSHADGQQGLPTDSELVSKGLIPILRKFKRPVYIVLDALDEASDRRENLLDVVTDIVDAQLSNVRLLVASRPEVRFEARLAGRGVAVSLEGVVDRDIECFVHAILSKETRWPAARKDDVKTKLLQRSSGMFRLVSLQLSDLRSRGWILSKVDAALSSMPCSLPDFYDRILKDITNPEMVANVCRTINWVIASRRPMQLVELVDALAFDFGNEPLRFDPDARMSPEVLVAACEGFISVTADVVKIAHSSVTEYFLSSRKSKDALDGYAEVQFNSAHFLIAQTCVAYLCSFDPDIPFATIPSSYPLAQYAAKNWGFHAKLVLDLSQDADGHGHQNIPVPERQLLLDRTLELFRQESSQYTTLCQLQSEIAQYLPPAVYLLVYAQIQAVLVELLMRGADVNAQSRLYGNTLQAAAERGHTDMTRLLLEKGAEVDAAGGQYGNALWAATRCGHIEIVKMLLENGANVNAKGGKYGNALRAASVFGHADIVAVLLEKGAVVAVEGLYSSRYSYD
ncbi:hypothetical protein DFH06DRAFT_1252145 [Mycena polygramma]|nr:hypothetical protein DFH06DRAFT_1252145 [Mycena polygramma]